MNQEKQNRRELSPIRVIRIVFTITIVASLTISAPGIIKEYKAINQAKEQAEHGYYEDALYIQNNYLAGRNITEKAYARMYDYSVQIKSYYDALDEMTKINTLMDEKLEQANADGESTDAIWQETRDMVLKKAEDTSLNSGIVYLYALAENEEKRIACLEASIKADPKLMAPETELGNLLLRRGDFEAFRGGFRIWTCRYTEGI